MYQHILIPYDGTSDARKGAEQGIGLAASIDATVHGLFVVKDSGNPWESTSMADQDERAEAHGMKILEELGEMAEDADVDFEPAVEIGGKVYEVINDFVEEENIDLIVMGSGYHGEFGGLLGSTADKVLRTVHVPVLTVRRELLEQAEAAPKRVAAK